MSNLRVNLQQKMHENRISAHALEKQAGLKASAVHNILYGRSKNPSINLIRIIAETLNCPISDLLDDKTLESQQNQIKLDSQSVSSEKETHWKSKLYVECLEVVSRILKSKKTEISKDKILDCVNEIYLYSLTTKKNTVDKKFAEWLIGRNL